MTAPGDPVETAALALAGRFDQTCDAHEDAVAAMTALHAAGWRIVRPTDDDPHYVVFKAHGWEIEHSASCRNAGQMLECPLNRHLFEHCDGPPAGGVGRYWADMSPGTLTLMPAPDAPTTTALLIVDEWLPEGACPGDPDPEAGDA